MSSKDICIEKTRIKTVSPRIQAQKLKFPSCKILWLNVYFPCDSYQTNQDPQKLVCLLEELESCISGSVDCEILVHGDINWGMTILANSIKVFSAILTILAVDDTDR